MIPAEINESIIVVRIMALIAYYILRKSFLPSYRCRNTSKPHPIAHMRNADLYDDHQMCPIALTKLLSHPQLSMNSLIPLEELVVSTNIFYRLF